MTERTRQRLNGLLAFIEDNLHNTLDLETLARHSHWSRWQMQRVFNQGTGLSVAQYIRELRLSQSATQLIASRRRHIDIAMNAGFNSEIAFIRSLRKHFGCTPKEYRQKSIPQGIRFPLTETDLFSIRLEKRPPLRLYGINRDINSTFFLQQEVKQQAPIAWEELHRILAEYPHNYSTPMAVIDASRSQSNHIRYWVGIEHSDGPLPEAFQSLDVPEQLYAVVSHHGPLLELGDTATWLITHWLNHTPYQPIASYCLEQYFDFDEVKENYHIDFWMPVRSNLKNI